jgi:iron complex outermembrane receptor protein
MTRALCVFLCGAVLSSNPFPARAQDARDADSEAYDPAEIGEEALAEPGTVAKEPLAEPTEMPEEPLAEPAPEADQLPARDAHHDDHDASHRIERIVVTGTPIEHDRDELAVPVDRIDRRELLGDLGATLGESLASQPGIATSGFTGGASRPVIRGQDAFRTQVTEDALSTQDVSRESPDHAVPVNPLAVERVEIVRGPATLRYGGGASAGVVNAITNRVPDELLGAVVTGEVFGAIDTVAERRDVALALDGGVGPVGWHLDALLRRSDDYEIPTGGRQNGTFADAFSGSIGGAYFFGDVGRFGVAYTRFDSDYGVPEEDEDASIDMTTNRWRFEGDWFAPATKIRELRVRGVYTDYEHDEKVEGVVGQTFRNNQFDGRLELLHEEIFGFLGALGVTGETRDLEALGEAEEYLAPSNTTSAALYIFEERALSADLVAELGFRVEGSLVEGTPFGATRVRDRSFVPLSGSLGLVYTPREDLSLGFVAGASQRAPAAVELFARGPHEATGTFEIGDPNLDPETSYTAELRGAFERERLRLEVAGFVTAYDDYVFGQLTGLTVDEEGNDPGALDQLFYRARNAVFAGTEVSANVDLFDALGGSFGVDAQMDYVRARFTSGSDRNVPRIPPIRWGANLSYRGAWLLGRFGFLRTQDQPDVSSFENPTDAFTFLNASLTLLLSPLYPRVPVEIGLQGLNLLDAKGRNVVSFKADEVLLPGRNIRATLRVRF